MTTLDVGKEDECEEVIRLAESLAPVAGIFHTATYLADKLLANQVLVLPAVSSCNAVKG